MPIAYKRLVRIKGNNVYKGFSVVPGTINGQERKANIKTKYSFKVF